MGWDIPTEPDQEIQLQVLRAGQLKGLSYHPRGSRRDILQFKPK